MTRRGSVLVIVMVTLIFAATALVAFLSKASNDLLIESRITVANRLRPDAYSALETALGVLYDFYRTDKGLHQPDAEGYGSNESWGNLFNLPWVQGVWAPPDGSTVDISFEDESAKISLSHILSEGGTTAVVNIFQLPSWGLDQADAEHLADVLQSWITQNPPHLPSVPPPPDYENGVLPYNPPYRALRSYDELRSIDFAKDIFFDAQGRPTNLFWRFVNDFSLFNYAAPDVNGDNEDVLQGAGQFTPQQIGNIEEFLADQGNFAVPNPLNRQYFTSTRQLGQVAGPGGRAGIFSTSISALRIRITVHNGSSQFRLEAVVAPPSGAQSFAAKTVETNATDGQQNNVQAQNGESAGNAPTVVLAPTQTPNNAESSAASGPNNIQFPYAILEIRENDEIMDPPPGFVANPPLSS